MISANDFQEVFIIMFGPVVAWTLVFVLAAGMLLAVYDFFARRRR